ncbi:hypothetical protein PHYPSEUDO_014600 [Phytophthora pseudosyringae]|uniref:NYN domain-containing protein n=1 Tax=Phytophthora pseudosyringae TaxID=221518 RepID=A0A8T1W3Q4_9STRA|nr:hypothetical protein PHYPSEUDO_014600 [Phytophthora pseudosyringae]
MIGARDLGGKIDYIKLRAALEEQASTQFGGKRALSLSKRVRRDAAYCWFFDQNPSAQRLKPALTAEYHMLKFAPPDGPQFQVSLYPMKKYGCHCRRCGNHFTQNVQKGVDNGIATKILSLAYENICNRFILFAGDGDFYSSLSHVRNVLRKDIWVIGYRGTVSGDLQQLASRVIWMNDLWSQVKSIQQGRSHEQVRKGEGRRDEGRKDEGRKEEEAQWFEDHEGEDFQFSNGSSSPLDEAQEVGSARQVVITPVEADTSTSNRSSQPGRGRARGRTGRLNGGGRGRKGRGRSRSRSRDRPRARLRSEPPTSDSVATPNALPDVESSTSTVPAGVEKKKKRSTAEEKRGAGGRTGKKRKRNGTCGRKCAIVYQPSTDVFAPYHFDSEGADNNARGRSKRGERGDKQADELLVFNLSDVSHSDEDTGGKPFPLSLPVPLRPAAAALVMTAQGRDVGMDEIGSRTEVIDLASDTESE